MTETVQSRIAAPRSRRLKVTDFMNIGIFFVVNTVAGIAVAFIGITPITYVMVSALQALVLGIPMMLFFEKVRKPGMLLVFGALTGISSLLLGLGIWCLLLSVTMAVVAELTLRAGSYQGARHRVFAYAFMAVTPTATYLPLFFATHRYLQESDMEARYGASFSGGLATIGQLSWLFVVIVIATFGCGILGGLLGRRVFTKHFQRAGIV